MHMHRRGGCLARSPWRKCRSQICFRLFPRERRPLAVSARYPRNNERDTNSQRCHYSIVEQDTREGRASGSTYVSSCFEPHRRDAFLASCRSRETIPRTYHPPSSRRSSRSPRLRVRKAPASRDSRAPFRTADSRARCRVLAERAFPVHSSRMAYTAYTRVAENIVLGAHSR